MDKLNNIVMLNRNNTKGLNLDDFGNTDLFKAWKKAVENLRFALSAYAVADRSNETDEERENSLSLCFEAYRAVLKFFENKSENFKLKPQAQDIHALRDVAGKYGKRKGSETGKDFLPVGAIAFRKAVEDFIADRCANRLAMTAEEIEAEKVARREAKKAEKKAKVKKAQSEADKAKAVEKSNETEAVAA